MRRFIFGGGPAWVFDLRAAAWAPKANRRQSIIINHNNNNNHNNQTELQAAAAAAAASHLLHWTVHLHWRVVMGSFLLNCCWCCWCCWCWCWCCWWSHKRGGWIISPPLPDSELLQRTGGRAATRIWAPPNTRRISHSVVNDGDDVLIYFVGLAYPWHGYCV